MSSFGSLSIRILFLLGAGAMCLRVAPTTGRRLRLIRATLTAVIWNSTRRTARPWSLPKSPTSTLSKRTPLSRSPCTPSWCRQPTRLVSRLRGRYSADTRTFTPCRKKLAIGTTTSQGYLSRARRLSAIWTRPFWRSVGKCLTPT